MLLFLFLAGTLQAQEEIEDDVRYKKRVEKYISRWEKLIPHYTKLQFAGSMGMLSLGTGWNYYRNHWETDVYLGIVPRNSDRHAMATLHSNRIITLGTSVSPTSYLSNLSPAVSISILF